MTAIMEGTPLASREDMGVRQILERAPALSGASSHIMDRMVASASERTLARGTYLWRTGEQACSLAIIRSGLLKVVRPAAQGRRALCALMGPPELVGDLAVMRDIPYPVDAIIATEVAAVITLPATVLTESLRFCPDLALSLVRAVETKLIALHEKVDVLSAGGVEARLATLLLQLYERFGDDLDDGTLMIPVVLSRRELADFVATSFETAIRTMTRWEKNGVVETTARGFTIRDLNALRTTAGDDSFAAA